MISRIAAPALALALACLAAPLHAATPEAPMRLSASDRATALIAIKSAIDKDYVFPERRPAIVARLEQSQKSGRYDVDDPGLFAERISEDMTEAGQDKHLWMRVDPAAYKAAMAPVGSDDGDRAFQRRKKVRNHYGLTEQKILPGNLRYLRIAGFEWVPDETGAAYDEAMRFLKESDAAIIDLRGNGGGSHGAVRYLVSHFLDGDQLELTILEGSKPPTQSRALEYLPAGRLKGKPLYVLIDGGVGSAAEAFAYDVQQFKLGELVGAKTAGAANNNNLLPVAPGFILSVSFGRPVHAVSQSNWEGTGVLPTIEAPPAQALEIAQSVALGRLMQDPKASRDNVAEYEWAKTGLDAKLHPVSLAPHKLQTMTGLYGEAGVGFGQIELALREDALWLVRADRPPLRLTPLNADGLFAVEGSDMLRVRVGPKAAETLWAGNPVPRVFPRKR